MIAETFYREEANGARTWFNPAEVETLLDERGKVIGAKLIADGAPVSIGVVGGRRHDGTVLAIGTDVVLLAERNDRVAIPVASIASFRPVPGAGGRAATGDRPPAVDVGFVELLARVVDDQPDVAISLVTGEVVETNDGLAGSPELVNSDPYGEGWMVKVRLAADGAPSDLLDAGAYDDLVAAG